MQTDPFLYLYIFVLNYRLRNSKQVSYIITSSKNSYFFNYLTNNLRIRERKKKREKERVEERERERKRERDILKINE